jgi:hypothetical protein
MTVPNIAMEIIAHLYDCTLDCNGEYCSPSITILGTVNKLSDNLHDNLGAVKRVRDTLHYNLRYSHKGERNYPLQSMVQSKK